MEYKYKKNQMFGKKLDVPEDVQTSIFANNLTIEDYINYNLVDKVPTSCLRSLDKQILDSFGAERLKTVDFELITRLSHKLQMKELLLKIEPTVEDINRVLYESVKDLVLPTEYSSRMKLAYPTRVFEIEESELTKRENQNDYDVNYLKVAFNRGTISLIEIVKNWELFQGMDLGYCLKNDRNNTFGITSEQLKLFMSEYGSIVEYIFEVRKNVYEVINEVNNEESKDICLKELFDEIIMKRVDSEVLTNEQYRVLFMYSSLENYLAKYNEYAVERLFDEIKDKDEDYLYNISIPISVLKDIGVLSFVGTYGLENILEFDKKHENFFTRNDFANLKLIAPAYLYRANNVHEPERKILKSQTSIEYIHYTKEEFYDALRKMIIYGPTDWDYVDRFLDISDLNGEFRELNSDLFLDTSAPEELKQLFYSKKITPKVLASNLDYVPFLQGKNFASCFENIEVLIAGDNYYHLKNIYQYLIEQSKFEKAMPIILQYADVFDIIFENYDHDFQLLSTDHFMGNLKKFHDAFRRKIIEEGKEYPKNIPANLLQTYPEMFIDENAPEELKNKFNERKITAAYILEHPEYEEYLRKIDLECLYKYVKVIVDKEGVVNLVSLIEKLYGKKAFDMMLVYGDYISQMYKSTPNIIFYNDVTINGLEERLVDDILMAIRTGQIKYNENVPSQIKEEFSTLFLPSDTPEEIKTKFYNREFTMMDFTNPEILKYFENTNIACGLGLEYAWLIELFKKEDIKVANSNKKKIYDAYIKIDDLQLQNLFKKFIIDNCADLDLEKLDSISTILERLSNSNSSEIYNFRNALAIQILNTSNPLDSLAKVEEIFLKNNIPTVGKIFSVFELLHPECDGFDFTDESMISPVLKEKSTKGRYVTIFADLIKAAFGSNNRSIKDYLENIENGYSIYLNVMSGQSTYDTLSEIDKKELNIFRNHLITLYNNTQKGKKDENIFESGSDIIDDITKLYSLFSPKNGSANYNLADRVISMFAHFAGIDTLEEAKGYFESKTIMADSRNRENAKSEFRLEVGDFIKGIGGIEYLSSILQNGVLSKEFLGSGASSDTTPLDTDLSMITELSSTNELTIDNTCANSYGPIRIVLKCGKFRVTRTKYLDSDIDDDVTKPETFYVGVADTSKSHHYGVRTGFGSTDIDYIVVNNYDERIGLEIALNGFYIPVCNEDGKILFTPEDYDLLRSKMTGLKYYGEETFVISENLNIPGVENYLNILTSKEATNKSNKDKIKAIISKALSDIGLTLKESLDKDLSPGTVELIGTGSSERNTDLSGIADMDFLLRLDRNIVSNEVELNKVRKILSLRFGKELDVSINSEGNLNLRNVAIDGVRIDIDISFAKKTDEIEYSTEMALNDRLAVIRKQEPTLYNYVISNILLAKQVMKENEVYKPNRGITPQGGLGGVGLENWILQYGGSFMDASKSFLEASEGKTFEEFKACYQVWDFGENHLAARKGVYIHDNFVKNNMTEEGYEKMKNALHEYFNKHNLNLSIDEKKYKKE